MFSLSMLDSSVLDSSLLLSSCFFVGGVGWVAHEILGIALIAQCPNSSFSFLFDFELGLGTWTRACQFVENTHLVN